MFLFTLLPTASGQTISHPRVALRDVPFEVVVDDLSPRDTVVLRVAGQARYSIAGSDGRAAFNDVVIPDTGTVTMRAAVADVAPGPDAAAAIPDVTLRVLPGWVSVLPPLVAILIALLLRNVIPALLIGVWLGATLLRSVSVAGAFGGLLDAFEIYVVHSLADVEHAQIILFSLMIGGMAVSYTHLRAHETERTSRMPSSA